MHQRGRHKAAGLKHHKSKLPQLYVKNKAGGSDVSPEFMELVASVCGIIGVPFKDLSAKELTQLLKNVSSKFIFSLIPLQAVTTSYNNFFNKNEDLLIALGKRKGSDAAYFARRVPIDLIVRYETDMWLIDALHQAGQIKDLEAAKKQYDRDFIAKYKVEIEFVFVEARPSLTSFFTKPKADLSAFDDERLNLFRASIGLDGVGTRAVSEITKQAHKLEEKTKFEDYWQQIKAGLNLGVNEQPENIFSQHFASIKSIFEKDMDLIQAMKNAGTIQKDEFGKCKQMYIKNFDERMMILKDLIVQLKKIESAGYKEKTTAWKDETSRYPQKHAVITALIDFLLEKKDMSQLQKVINANPKFNKTAKSTPADTVLLMKRVLEYKEQPLDRPHPKL